VRAGLSLRLLAGIPGTPSAIVIADKGPWGLSYRERLAAAGIELLTPAKERVAANEHAERRLSSTRLAIESVFFNLKGQMRRPATDRGSR
jgi:hypothetical protein